ncbi:hypothetical protein N5079_28010 [Planotetraspora sp. A-T 1434]|uniref:hypothetical protein n=1 Tax=Planotetraspora sp. A-T 1434 TaxID=2979219 RepID=UPI0021C0B1C6|nr:hypothetical protein [Planotetraspora sp. A-T 1434]MCT9934061.1 hypothetical protein [Planotetraspora sp. A-T 1434]
MAGMLYYPGTAPPDEAIRQAVLYWDFRTTIAPPGVEPRSEILRRVEDAGLYRSTHVNDDQYNRCLHQLRRAGKKRWWPFRTRR